MGGRSAVGIVLVVWIGMLACSLGRIEGRSMLAAACGAWVLASWFVIATRHAARDRKSFTRLADLSLIAALVFAGAARAAGHRDVVACQRETHPLALHRIEARVVEPPLRESGMPSATVRVLASTPPLTRGSRLRLWLPSGSTAEWGDRVAAMVVIDPPGPARNPGGRSD